jgi:hypothetical protein
MNIPGHPEAAFCIPEGQLLLNPNRDSAFPYLYKVDKHPLVTDQTHIQTILVLIVDTSKEARHALYNWESTLKVPLGPDSRMDDLGMFIQQTCR